jgi:RimJ/RimL family protein N-acetyltransferase
MKLTSDRLHLRPFVAQDLDQLIRLFSDPAVMRYSMGLKDDDWVLNWLTNAIHLDQKNDPIKPYAAIRAIDSVFLGYCSLNRNPNLLGKPEIELGYRLQKSFWGQGFGKEAVQLLINAAFNDFGVSRIVALIDPNNKPSIKIAINLGMRVEGQVMLPGYDHPDLLYTIEKTESASNVIMAS